MAQDTAIYSTKDGGGNHFSKAEADRLSAELTSGHSDGIGTITAAGLNFRPFGMKNKAKRWAKFQTLSLNMATFLSFRSQNRRIAEGKGALCMLAIYLNSWIS